MNIKISSGFWWSIGVTIMVILLAIIVNTRAHVVADQGNLVTTTQTASAPWQVEIKHLRQRLDTIGLPALTVEGSALHIHQHLDIFVNGKHFSIPAGIGINESAGFIAPIHVHDDTGIIHVESNTIQTFNLGQFFDIWGVQFNKDCLGSYCANKNSSLLVYVNGKLYKGDIRQLALVPHQEIVVIYGIPTENPKMIPSTYTFPAYD